MGTAGFLLVFFAALVLWLRYVALPNVDSFREEIVSSIEQASGMSITVRSIHGRWGGLRPVVSLEGLTLADRGGRAAFQLERADVSLSWWSLLAGEVLFHDVDFYRPDLELRRGADGLIYLADKPLNAAGEEDGAFTEWLLAQPRVGIHRATLTWRDDFAGAPPVTLTQVEIAVVKRRGHHRASLTAMPPRELAGRIDLRADVVLSRRDRTWRAAGDAYAETLNADLGGLRAYLPVPETLRSGVGSLRVWAQFSADRVEEVVADLSMRDARAQLAADVLPLELATVAGRATYRGHADGFAFTTEGLRFRLANGVEAQPGNFALTRTAPAGKPSRIELRADGIDLKIAATLLDYYPVPRDVKNQVLRFAPRGRISDATIAWSEQGEPGYSVRGRFEELALNAVDAWPGVSGLTGHIEGTEAGGTLALASRHASVELARLFRAPFSLDALDLKARWRHAGRTLEVTIDEAHVVNPDTEARFAGLWRSLPDSPNRSPGFVEVKGTFSRADPARVAQYLPNTIEATRVWLQDAVKGGEVTRASFELTGDLWEFPFGGASKGRFLVEGDMRGGRLRYHPAWPSVDGIDGTFRFENRRMEIRAARAAIFASRVNSASAVIEDLSAKPAVLVIQGDVDTSGADSVRFLRESPLVDGPGAFTRVVAIEGPGRLKLNLVYPLSGADPVKVAGDYDFAGATASVGRNVTLRDVKGRLSFTESGVRAPQLTGSLFSKPATLAMATEADGRVATTLEGGLDTSVLEPHLPEAMLARLSGATTWKARVLSGKAGTELLLTSDLRGIASTLPEPLAKPAETARALSVQVLRLGADDSTVTASLAGGVHGRFARLVTPAGERWQVALKSGAPIIDEPVRDGLYLYGNVGALDVDAWMAVFAKPRRTAEEEARIAAERSRGLELRGVDLRIGKLRYLGRDFDAMQARLERTGMQWNGRVASPLVAGELLWDPQGRGRVVAKLERLAIPESKAEPKPARTDGDTDGSDLPALDVVAERFEFRGRTMGKLDLKAEPAGDEWRIDRLDIGTAHASLTSKGLWRRTAAGPLTTLAVRLEASNLNALFAQFGYGDYLKRGTGHLEGTLVWSGYPYDFATAILSGSFKVSARGGQFAKIEPGAGKLLGLLSLQSLPRRAMFDFRDVFSEGFAFDRIEGDVKLARGVLITENFEINGSSAFVSIAGEVSVPNETQNLTMRVVPEIGEGMALAATVFGTPVLGLSTLLVSKLLKNPIGKVVAYEYQVTGTWDNPEVTRTSAAPRDKAAASAPR